MLCCVAPVGTEPSAFCCGASPPPLCFIFLRWCPFLPCTIVRLHETAQELRGGAYGGPRGPQRRNAFALRATPRGEGGAPGDVPERRGCSHRSAPTGKA